MTKITIIPVKCSRLNFKLYSESNPRVNPVGEVFIRFDMSNVPPRPTNIMGCDFYDSEKGGCMISNLIYKRTEVTGITDLDEMCLFSKWSFLI